MTQDIPSLWPGLDLRTEMVPGVSLRRYLEISLEMLRKLKEENRAQSLRKAERQVNKNPRD